MKKFVLTAAFIVTLSMSPCSANAIEKAVGGTNPRPQYVSSPFGTNMLTSIIFYLLRM